MANEGEKAPEFALKDQDGRTHKLSDYKGKKVVLYFYPKDDTPGCTKEACSFRDNYSAIKKKGAVILGVSADDEKSHSKFIRKYDLPFALLSDPGHDSLEKYSVWKKKQFMGRVFMGIERTTIILDEKGNITKIFPKVSVDGHTEEILKSL